MWGLKEIKSRKSKKSNPKTNFLYFHFHFRNMEYGIIAVISKSHVGLKGNQKQEKQEKQSENKLSIFSFSFSKI
jgi:hypothetical protein